MNYGVQTKMQRNIHPMAEYIDALVTCELAMMLAIKDKKNPNLTVRLCSAIMSLKCSDSRNKQLFLGVSKSESPAVMIYQFRTMLDEQLSL